LNLSSASLPDWVICGGKSGPKARLMDPAWARDLRDACQSKGVAFFIKQMTRKAPIPDDLLLREFPRRISLRRRRITSVADIIHALGDNPHGLGLGRSARHYALSR
jgi:hypothetical protein